MPFYAVANGREKGIFSTWDACNQSVKGYKNAVYKKFATKTEAEDFIHSCDTKPVLSNQMEYIKRQLKVKPDYFVYTDGSCINNGKHNATAGIGIFFDVKDPRNISKKLEEKQTNNVAEITALIETFPIIKNDLENGKHIAIVSDSEYAIRCATSYGEKCSLDGWCMDIPNKALVKKVYELYKDTQPVHFVHIRAHTCNTDVYSRGNDFADKLANQCLL